MTVELPFARFVTFGDDINGLVVGNVLEREQRSETLGKLDIARLVAERVLEVLKVDGSEVEHLDLEQSKRVERRKQKTLRFDYFYLF